MGEPKVFHNVNSHKGIYCSQVSVDNSVNQILLMKNCDEILACNGHDKKKELHSTSDDGKWLLQVGKVVIVV